MLYLKRKPLNRRRVLRGILGGTTLALGLPMLEVFHGGTSSAFADSSAFPKRYCQFFWGNGILPPQWTPQDTGERWTLSDQLQFVPVLHMVHDVSIYIDAEA